MDQKDSGVFAPKSRKPGIENNFSREVVGRFRSGKVVDEQPVTLSTWRVTTGDPEVAAKVSEKYGGAPQSWDARGEDGIEIMLDRSRMGIYLRNLDDIQLRYVQWEDGKLLQSSDGQRMNDGTKDPDANLSIFERKQKHREDDGMAVEVNLTFRLSGLKPLGKFLFRSSSWGFAEEVQHGFITSRLTVATTFIKAALELEEVKFTPKKGPNKGEEISYMRPTLELL